MIRHTKKQRVAASKASEQLASFIAKQILDIQLKWANWMNRKFNTISIFKKKAVTIFVGVAVGTWSIVLIIGIDVTSRNKPSGSSLPAIQGAGRLPLPSDSLVLMEQVYKSKNR